MVSRLIPLALIVALAAGCTGFSITGEAGLAHLEFDGETSYTLGPDKISQGGLNPGNDIGTDFGLDDPETMPYLKLQGQVATMAFSGSAFQVDTNSRGRLSFDFGALPPGQSVETDLKMTNLRGAVYPFDFSPLPMITIRPGLGMDFFDLNVKADAIGGILQEEIDAYAPIPLICLQVRADIWLLEAVLEGGFMEIPSSYSEDFQGSLIDLEGTLRYRASPGFTLFAGYRYIRFDGDGEDGGDEYEMDLTIGGWMVGAGLHF